MYGMDFRIWCLGFFETKNESLDLPESNGKCRWLQLSGIREMALAITGRRLHDGAVYPNDWN
jgi:hypothetical protein